MQKAVVRFFLSLCYYCGVMFRLFFIVFSLQNEKAVFIHIYTINIYEKHAKKPFHTFKVLSLQSKQDVLQRWLLRVLDIVADKYHTENT